MHQFRSSSHSSSPALRTPVPWPSSGVLLRGELRLLTANACSRMTGGQTKNMRTHPDEKIRFSVLGYAFVGRGLIRNGHGICTYAPKAANREGDCSFSTKSANLNSPASREAGPGGKRAGCLMSYARRCHSDERPDTFAIPIEALLSLFAGPLDRAGRRPIKPLLDSRGERC
jgi:hypothetical protein